MNTYKLLWQDRGNDNNYLKGMLCLMMVVEPGTPDQMTWNITSIKKRPEKSLPARMLAAEGVVERTVTVATDTPQSSKHERAKRIKA